MKATYSLNKQDEPGPDLHEGTGYTASLRRIRIYVWFVDAPVAVTDAEEDVEEAVLLVKPGEVEVAFVKPEMEV
jgi:hypothetical protein